MRMTSEELGAGAARRFGVDAGGGSGPAPHPVRPLARAPSGGLQNIAEVPDAPGAGHEQPPQEDAAMLARLLQQYDQSLPLGSPPETPVATARSWQ